MNASIKQLNKGWDNLRKELKEKQITFDEKYRKNNENHDCDTKVYAHNGNWFCKHLTKARYQKLRGHILEEEEIISSIISLTE